MPTRKIWIPLAVLLLFLALPGHAQKSRNSPVYMYYMVQDGDTVYLDTIQPAWVFPKGSRVNKTDWRKYCKLVYNFNKVYPYALLGKKLSEEVDLTIETQNLKRRKRDKGRSMGSRQRTRSADVYGPACRAAVLWYGSEGSKGKSRCDLSRLRRLLP